MDSRIAVLLLSLAALAQAQATLKGRVVSAVSGRPVAGARVEVQPAGRAAASDSSGRFQIDSLPSGTCEILASHDRYEPVRISGVILLGGATEEREIELPPPILVLAERRTRATPVAKIYDMPNSSHAVDPEEIRRTPGALMDVQRVVQKFPGVQSRGDNVNEVIARGGFPGENLFILDNIEIPNPNYFANQGTGGGVISVVNPLLVKKLTFNSGAPPARYGGKASSVMDISLREGTDKMIFGGLDLGFAGAGLHAEGPLWPGATFLSSFRKSYLDFVAEFEPSTAIPKFWGGQAKVTQNYGSGKLFANGLLGKSSIRIENAEESFGTEGDVIDAGGDIFAAGGTMAHRLGDHWEVSTTLAGTGNIVERKQFFKGQDTVLSERRTQEYEHVLKAEASRFTDAHWKWTFGGEVKRIELRDANRGMADTLKTYASAADSVGTPFVDPAGGGPVEKWIAPGSELDAEKWAAYASVNFPLFKRLSLALGARAEGFTLSEDIFAMPRAALRWTLTDEIELSASAGLQTQTQNALDYSARPENHDLPSKRTAIASLETDWFLPKLSAHATLNVYVKSYDHLLLDSALAAPDPFLFQSSPARIEGTALSRGVELFIERKLDKDWFYSLAYAWSVSEMEFPGINGGEAFPSDFDYTHLANATGGYVLELMGRPWYRRMRESPWFKSLCWLIPIGDRNEYSFRLRHATGRPYTPLAYDTGFRRWRLDTDAMNSERFPDYWSLDLRLERRVGYGWLRMMFYFDFQNVLARDNVFTYVYNDATGKRVTVKQLPFFPMGGFIIGF